MPRKIEFDPQAAVTDAMGVFWEKGYVGTSYDDLVAGTGVSRASLYKAFGDKKAIYLKVLDRYKTETMQPFLKVLSAEGASIAELIGFLKDLKQYFESQDSLSRGCLFCNSNIEMAGQDEEITRKLTELLDIQRAGFRNVFVNARLKGELYATDDIERLADTYATTLMGLGVMAKTTLARTIGVNTLNNLISDLESRLSS